MALNNLQKLKCHKTQTNKSVEQPEDSVLDGNLYIYINHNKNLPKDFKAQFKDLLNKEIPELIIALFEVKMQSTNINPFLKEKLIEKAFDLETKSMFTFKWLGY